MPVAPMLRKGGCGSRHLDDVLAKGWEGQRAGEPASTTVVVPVASSEGSGSIPVVRGAVEDVQNVQIDEAGSDVETARVDDLVARAGVRRSADRGERPSASAPSRTALKALGRIEDRAALDQHARGRHRLFAIAANCSSVRVTSEG